MNQVAIQNISSQLPTAVQSLKTFEPQNHVKLREPLLGVVVGKKGAGKTVTTNKLIYRYINGLLKKDTHARKVLILDVNDEFTHIRAISLRDIIRFSAQTKIEARRVRIWKEDGTKMTLNEISDALFTILEHFKEGMLLIEDINKYVSDSLPSDLIGAICTQRHVGCDIIMHFQGIGSITPKIWKNCNWVRFHRNGESVEVHRKKFPEKEEGLKILEAMVNEEFKRGGEGKWFYAYYDCDEEKIKGAYSQKMLYNAIMIYLEENYKRVITPLLNRVDLRSGSFKKMAPQEAVSKVASKLFLSYYGNDQQIPV